MKTLSSACRWLASGALALLIPYLLFQVLFFPRLTEIEWYSVISEASVAVIALVAILLLSGGGNQPRTYLWMLFGFSALLFSSVTDVLDEFVAQPHFVTLFFEDLLQLLGYGMVVVGIWHWLVVNRQLHDELNERVVTDYLTGAMNRRGFMEQFEQELNRAARYNSSLSLIWFDLDNFKAINDRYGHHRGDEVLRSTARQVFGLIRQVDIFSRMGGEEFCILMPETSIDGAMEAAEKLRQAFAVCDCGDELRVTASFGVDEYRQGDSVESLLKRVDDALYQAKLAGRNRVLAGVSSAAAQAGMLKKRLG